MCRQKTRVSASRDTHTHTSGTLWRRTTYQTWRPEVLMYRWRAALLRPAWGTQLGFMGTKSLKVPGNNIPLRGQERWGDGGRGTGGGVKETHTSVTERIGAPRQTYWISWMEATQIHTATYISESSHTFDLCNLSHTVGKITGLFGAKLQFS